MSRNLTPIFDILVFLITLSHFEKQLKIPGFLQIIKWTERKYLDVRMGICVHIYVQITTLFIFLEAKSSEYLEFSISQLYFYPPPIFIH